MHSRVFFLLPLIFLSCQLFAQRESPSRYQVYSGYSYLSNSLDGVPGSHQGLNGFDAAVAFPPWHRLRFRVDVSAYRGTNLAAPQHPFYFLGGGQYGWRLKRESLFVEGLIGTGGANKTWAADGAVGQTASFASLVGGGLDTTVARHLAFRVEGGYQYTYFALSGALNVPYRIQGLPTNFGRVSSGMVWNF